MKICLSAFYGKWYRGELSRVRSCRYAFDELLDVVPKLQQCGPVWCVRQFSLERLRGILPAMVPSGSRSHTSLTNALTKKHKSELILSSSYTNHPAERAAATGAGEDGGSGDDHGSVDTEGA